MSASERTADDAAAPKRWPRRRLRALQLLLTVLVALIGAAIGIALVPATQTTVGPLTATVHLRPSFASDTAILLPPAGEVIFDSHRAPVRIEARVTGVDIGKAEELLYSDDALAELESTAPNAITSAAATNAALNTLFATLGAGVAVALVFRRMRRSLIAGGTVAGVVLGSAALTTATFRPESLNQPRFDGLLSQAAYVADLGHGTVVDYANYRSILAEFVGQVSALYIAADQLPAGFSDEDVVTVLHVSDIHDNVQAFDVIEQLDNQFDLDLVIDTGDIVSWGTSWENDLLSAVGRLNVPYVYIKGNHDGAATASMVENQPNGIVLDNEVTEVEGLTIAGIGDPRFAADDDSDAGGWREGKEAVKASGFQLGDTIEEYNDAHPDAPVDVTLIHDPSEPAGLLGRTDLVLSGHMHTSEVHLDRDGSGTDWMVVGSTGGALASGGVRPVLDGGEPLDLTARLLHFDRSTGDLISYDDIVMGGLGLVSVSVSRHQMPAEHAELRPPDGEPTPDSPIHQDEGESVPDQERVTPTDPAHPWPASDAGGENPAAPRQDEQNDRNGQSNPEPADDDQ